MQHLGSTSAALQAAGRFLEEECPGVQHMVRDASWRRNRRSPTLQMKRVSNTKGSHSQYSQSQSADRRLCRSLQLSALS